MPDGASLQGLWLRGSSSGVPGARRVLRALPGVDRDAEEGACIHRCSPWL